MLTLLIGRSGCGKTTALIRRVCATPGKRILLVPEQSSHEAERRLCEGCGNCAVRDAEVLSFTRLADRVFAQAGGLAAPTLDGGGRLLMMYEALMSVSDRLTVYARPSRKPALLSALLATFDELKSCCITPAELGKTALELEGTEGEKLRDISLICGAYEALCAQGPLDPRDTLTRLAEALDGCSYASDTALFIDGFTDFTPQELQVLRRLIRRCPSVTVVLTCDHLKEDEGGTGVFSPARYTAERLLRIAREEGILTEAETLIPEKPLRVPDLDFLEQNLFAPSPEVCGKAPSAVALFSAWSPRSEVEWTAAQILELARKEGFRYREIAVTARSLSSYGDLIESVFARYGIPVFVTAQTFILEKPVLALVTAALDTVAGDYSPDDLFRYLKTGLTDLSPDDCDVLENYTLKWNLKGSRWTAKKDWAMHPRGYGYPFEETDSVLLERLNALRHQVTSPLEGLRKNQTRTGKGQAIALYTFLESIHLPERLEARTKTLTERGELTLAQEYSQLWDILTGALEQCAALLGETPMELAEFSALLQLVLSQYTVGAIPVSLDRVTAGEAPRIANRGVKALFLLGADDASIPQAASSPGLFSDDDRSLLASFGLETAPRLEEKLYREMTVVYTACAKPTQRLFITWPRAGTDGEEKSPSFLVDRVKKLFPALKILDEGAMGGSFRLAAPGPALEQAGKHPEVLAALEALPEYRERAAKLERMKHWERGHLSGKAVEELYGRRVPMSASRMDKYKSCHFSYFMQYGLRAEPRTAAGFDAPEYGTFVHYVLENVFRESTRPTKEQVKRVVDRYSREELGGMEDKTPRFRYLFTRLLRSVWQVVENVAEELAASDFLPLSFELGFGAKGDLPPVEFTQDGVTVSVSGFVDRVDGWVKDNRIYLRVVDYKTGRKSFDLTEIWNGIGLQMLLYLFTLERKGISLYGKEIIPAGVLYLPAREAVIAGSRSMDEESRRKAVDRELRRRGLLLDDPEVLNAMERPGEGGPRFLPLKVSARNGAIGGDSLASAERLGRLGRHIDGVLREICGEIAGGKITADPFWRSPQKNACLWCDYKAACHFEEGRSGDCRRYLKTVKSEEFWAWVEEKTKETP